LNARRLFEELFTPVDARAPAAFRIALGAVAFLDLVDRARDAFTFYSNQGLLAAGSPGDAVASPTGVVLFFAAGLLVTAALAAGYRTRAAAVATLLVAVAIQARHPAIDDGGDTLLRVLCLWGVFVDGGGRWSLDVRLGRRPAAATVPGFPVRLLQLQIALVYLTAGLAKTGASWRDGSAVYYAVQSTDYGRPLGAWLAARLPALTRPLSFGTVAIELAFAPLVLAPVRSGRWRALGLLLGLALHAGIASAMRVGIFSWVLPASYTIFLRPRWLDRAGPATGLRAPPPPLAAKLLWGALALQMAAVLVQLVAGRRVPGVSGELTLVGLGQRWAMFTPDPPRKLNAFTGRGRLADGTEVDVLARVVPGLVPRGGFFFSRWYKYRSDLARTRPAALEAFGRYVCRRWNGQVPGPPLDRFTLVLSWRDLAPPGQPPLPWQGAEVLRQRCR
jgi:hypothetical protein